MQNPTHKTLYSAGADLESIETLTIPPNRIRIVCTGFALSYDQRNLVDNLVFMLAIRSSIALKKGLMLANSIGVIDNDYTDEIKVMLFNPTDTPVKIERGERIAQLIPMQYVQGVFDVESKTRKGGFGSTGQSS